MIDAEADAKPKQQHEPSPVPGDFPHVPAPMQRPTASGMRALAHLLDAYPSLPDLEFTFMPEGHIVGRVGPHLSPMDASLVLGDWMQALQHENAEHFHQGQGIDGPFEWAEISTAIAAPHVIGRMHRVTVVGRKWAIMHPFSAAFRNGPVGP